MTRQLVNELSAAPIRNLALSDDAWLVPGASNWSSQWFGSGSGAGTLSVVQNAGPSGCGIYRKTWTTSGGALDIGSNYTFPKVFKPNTYYTFSAGVMATWATGHTMAVIWFDSAGNTLSPGSIAFTQATSKVATTPGQRVRLVGGLTSPTNAAYARLVWGPYPTLVSGASANPPSPGDSLDCYEPMAVEGPYTGDFSCASLPGAGWSKLPDGTSVGYPYTLGRVLGGRRFWLVEGNNSVTVPDLGAYAARSLFGAYTSTGSQAGTYPSSATYGQSNATVGGIKNQLNGPSNATTGARADYASGSTNVVGYGTGRTVGLHTFSAVLNQGLATGRYRIDGGAVANNGTFAPASVGSGLPGALTLQSVANNQGVDAEIQSLGALLAEGSFTETQELAVHGWLSNHYGIPFGIPSANSLDSFTLDTSVLG
jgi:hypothetical protein